ncbi:MAG TPA: hypothetical protein VN958_12330, partial [Chitinophagaceae bacterium]|nr:hypothetical protein [Chitinophagaceae bacterium]
VNWEMTFGLMATLLFVFAIQICFLAARNVFSKERTRQFTVIFIVTGLYCFVAIVFYFSPLAFRDMFPGFLLTPDKSNWIDRNINVLGFIAFILAIIPIIFKIAKWIWHGKTTDKENKVSNEV